MGIIRKITEAELLGGAGNKDIYPVTSDKAVFNEDNINLSTVISNIKSNALQHGSLEIIPNEDSVTIKETNINGEQKTTTIDAVNVENNKAGLITPESQKKLDDLNPKDIEDIESTLEEVEEEIQEIKKGNIQKIIWNNTQYPNLSDMNKLVIAGVYELSGEHTRINDNLPIANTGSGHTFNARLTVLDSSIERTKGEPQSDDKCITQILNFNNRLGQGEVYIRTGKGKTLDSLTWDNWSTLQRNVNVGQVNKLDNLVDNGIYSGVYIYGSLPNVETFVMIVINDYAVASEFLNNRSVSQLKYSYNTTTNKTTVQHRKLEDGSDTWSDWEDIGGSYTLPIATKDTLGGVKVYETKGKVSSGPSGAEYSVNIRPDGTLYSTVDHADETHEGVVYVDSSIKPKSNNPVSGKAVAKFVEDVVEKSTVYPMLPTASIEPNKLYIWEEVESLNITLAEGKDNVINEYMFQFTSGATATTLVLPADIKWLSTPNVQANKTYQVSIINNLGVIGEFGDE